MAGLYDWARFPLVPGHEIAGRVAARGPGAEWLAEGSFVGVTWVNRSCMRCVYCHRGDFVLCPQALSTGVDTPGGYQEYLLASAATVIPLPESLSPVLAAPLMCAGLTSYDGLVRAGDLTGRRVAVLGFGGLGRYAVHFAVKMGARVGVVSTSETKRHEAVSLGAELFVPRSDAFDQLTAWDGGPEVIVSTAPTSELVSELAPTLVADGHVVVLGIGAHPLKFDSHDVVDKRLTVHGSALGSVKDAERMLAFVRAVSGQPDVVSIPFDEVQRAIALAASGKATGRVVLTM